MASSIGSSSMDPRCTGKGVLKLLTDAQECIIIAPFVTTAGLQPILDVIGSNANLTVYTRWRVNEVARGVSDLGVYDLVKARGGTVFLHPALHAKVYLCPGVGALAGSANTTVTGLGWDRAHSLELLTEVSDQDPSVRLLLELLESYSSIATNNTRDYIDHQVELFSNHNEHVRSAQPPSGGHIDSISWLPNYSQPDVVWRVYNGERDISIAKLVEPDLAALDPPPGLSQPQFNAYVATVLQQGFTGIIAQNLTNLTTYQAIKELTQMAAQAGIDLDDPERTWKTLVNWFSHFLPDDYTRAPGGRTLYG